jgi:hypothetical protein
MEGRPFLYHVIERNALLHVMERHGPTSPVGTTKFSGDYFKVRNLLHDGMMGYDSLTQHHEDPNKWVLRKKSVIFKSVTFQFDKSK